MRRRGRVTAALVAAAALLGGTGTSAVHGAAPCAGVTLAGGWKKIEAPLRAEAFTVDATGRIFVAADRAVAVSSDGGCSWAEALDLADAPAAVPPAPDERVGALAATESAVVAALSGPSVLITRDGGTTWTRSTAGLDIPGVPLGLYPAGGDVLYMLVRQEASDAALSALGLSQGASAVATVVYRSADAGRTWSRGDDVGVSYTGPHGSDVDGGSAPGAAWDLAVDPGDANHLLAAATDGVFESTDGGRQWSAAVFLPGARFRAVAAWRAGGSLAAVAVDPSTGTVYETRGAAAWRRANHPQLRTELMQAYPGAAAWAWAAAAPGGGAAVSGPKGVFEVAGGSIADVTPHGLAGPAGTVAGLQTIAGADGGALWGRLFDGSALVAQTAVPREPGRGSRSGRRTPVTPPAGAGRATAVRPPRVDEGDVRLAGGVRRLRLAPGESATVELRALIDPRPVTVDVYFLVDTTSSMSDAIRALVEGMEDIVLRLARSGVRLRAGVGSFRSYPRESDRVVENHAYRRVRALGPVDAELIEGLYSLEGRGSSGANLTALVQSVTGAGQDVLPPGPSKADVAPGQEAGFASTLNVVVHMADTWFGTPARGDPNGYYAPRTWPGPPFADATAALRSAGVLHLGVALQPGEGGTAFADGDVVDDMRRVSRETSSLAGERGADCDGDGDDDLGAGEPLVCLLERGSGAGGLASVVTGLVEALEKRGAVRLVEAGDSGLVRAIAPEAYPDVDLRGAQSLPFEVTVGCGLADAGAERTVRLELLVDEQPSAASAVRVSCGELPARLVVQRPPRRPVALALVPPIPAPPPPPHPVPGPGSVTAPAPVQAPAPAQAPGGHPQATAVAQRQQQPQPAFAAAVRQVRAQTQMEHALVRTRGRHPLDAARLWTAVGGLSILWTWGLVHAAAVSLRRQSRRPRWREPV